MTIADSSISAGQAGAPERPFVRFEAVTKRFGAFTAVDQLTLNIYEGEFFALLGPSGCGKSTLLRMLAGFETPDAGRVVLAGEDLVGVPPYRRPVNMMFQNYALFPHMTAARNVAFGLKQEGLPRAAIDARVSEMLKLVQLEDFAQRKPAQLSGGQRQRVALARALAKHPKVLLLDEPLAALDRRLREQTRFELVDLQARLGTTFVIVTHDQDEAMGLADRIAVMDRGRIVQVGPPAEIYERPNSRYVASFVGDVNLIDGQLAAVSADEVAIESFTCGRLHAAGPVDARPGAPVWIALRPEKVRLAATAPAPDDDLNTVAGTVVDIGYLGNSSVYKVRLDSGAMLTATVPNLTRETERAIGWDARVWLSWPIDAGVVLTQ